MTAFAIRFHRRRWLANNPSAGDPARGWRPFIWTASGVDAEKFGSREAAQAFLDGLNAPPGAEVVPFLPLPPARAGLLA